MTNDKTVTMSREHIEQALLAMKRIYQAGYDRILELGGSCDTPEYMMAGDPTATELRDLLAAPVVERQEPVGRVSYIGNGFIRVRCSVPPALETLLYASQPAPVSVVLPERVNVSSESVPFRNNYIADGYISGWNACLDKVKEMNNGN